ncbi:MAG: response regulator [Synergistaceae bacterium]|jgi:putative two-component system response regulator|nr:response regulator [Synergistaceae bacterium]
MKKILVVDDNTASLKNISAMLSGSYEVLPARSGRQAVDICVMKRPDLILLDLIASGTDGLEVIGALRGNPILSGIPIILITAKGDTGTEARGLKAGAADFIRSPVEKRLLLHRLDLHLRFSSYKRVLDDHLKQVEGGLSAIFADLIEGKQEGAGKCVTMAGKYVELLARKLADMGMFESELSDDGIEMMSRAAPLHDIGKIAISDRYLLKPDRLDDEEFAVMKRHAAIGAEILEGMHARMPTRAYLGYAKAMAAHHHERFDGRGYPGRLSEDGIPLCGRIMAVADVYDALVCDRVYRRGFDHGQARNIIIDGRGSQFDPRIVKAFESCHGQFAALAEHSRIPA